MAVLQIPKLFEIYEILPLLSKKFLKPPIFTILILIYENGYYKLLLDYYIHYQNKIQNSAALT